MKDLAILSYRKMAKLFTNSGDPDQTPHSVASDLGMHCLPLTLLGVSRLQWVNPFSTADQYRYFCKQCRSK